MQRLQGGAGQAGRPWQPGLSRPSPVGVSECQRVCLLLLGKVTTGKHDSGDVLDRFLVSLSSLKKPAAFRQPRFEEGSPTPPVLQPLAEPQNRPIKRLSLIMKFACRKHLAHLEGTLRARVST